MIVVVHLPFPADLFQVQVDVFDQAHHVGGVIRNTADHILKRDAEVLKHTGNKLPQSKAAVLCICILYN